MKLITILLLAASLLTACDMERTKPAYESSGLMNYPSGSTICYAAGSFYIMGDDAADILVLDGKMNEIERIGIFERQERARHAKRSKADVESSALISYEGQPAVLFLGSGSLSPHRDSAFIFNPESKQTIRINTKTFYDQLRKEVSDLNIEGGAMIGSDLVLALRANKSNPDNYLAVSRLVGQSFTFQRKIQLNTLVNGSGISGLDYSEKEDILFITFSSEDTSNSYDDGRIGESYLAFVRDAKNALKEDDLVIRDIVKLTDISPEFADQKIESVSLTSEQGKLMLVADDDQGGTKVFMIRY